MTKSMHRVRAVQKLVPYLIRDAQMQGAQEPYREAYYTYVERCGLQRNTAYERFSTVPHDDCAGAITITSFIDFWSAFSIINVIPPHTNLSLRLGILPICCIRKPPMVS